MTNCISFSAETSVGTELFRHGPFSIRAIRGDVVGRLIFAPQQFVKLWASSTNQRHLPEALR